MFLLVLQSLGKCLNLFRSVSQTFMEDMVLLEMVFLVPFGTMGFIHTFFGSQGIVYMPVTPTLPNNESNSAGVGANIPDNVNVLFSGGMRRRFPIITII